ncbi:MAG: hypothetical protein BMS9Abin17_1363 [Acidimicrobiia bacterium]|nr:MAG: hypothetical protein BMS9Abin17_1363 [Acidimicrobiia bacterium]
MNDLAPIFRRVAAINPVPDETDLPATVMATTALLDAIDERNGTLKTQQIQRTQNTSRNRTSYRRTGVLAAIAAFVIVIGIGGAIVFTAYQAEDTSTAVASQPAAFVGDVMLARDVLPRGMANAMEDTIRTDSLLTIDRSAYDSRFPERLDIVLYANPRQTDGIWTEFLSRVIGLPGETIEARDGVLYVDGRILDEPYIKNPQIPMLPFGPITLGADEVWLMGDNRQNGLDSRDGFGPIPISELLAEVTEIANP